MEKEQIRVKPIAMVGWGLTGAVSSFCMNGLRNRPLLSNPMQYTLGILGTLAYGYAFETFTAKLRYHTEARVEVLRNEQTE